MKVIIVGGVAGGASAAARLRRLDEQAEIVLLERGPYISFANCGLPYYISGEIRDRAQLSVQTPESFAARFAVDVRILSEAVDVDRNSKTVTIVDHATGRRYQERYDKLLLSPGAEPVRPPLPGVDNARIFTLRTIPDAVAIRTFLETQHPTQALIVGAGYIGMEMAEALHTAGLHVTVVEMLPHAIGPLDYDMACQVHQYAREKGVQLKLNCGVASFEEKGSALFAHLTDGSLLPCDLVLLSTGVRPDTALAKKAGLETNEKGAILVNDELRTSAEDIYAVGDAIAIRDAVTDLPGYVPLAGPANKQGRLAADNLCGAHKRYRGTQGSAVLKLFDLTIATTGLNERAARAAGLPFDAVHLYTPSHASYYPGSTGLSLKVLFHTETGRILGAQLVGFEGVDKRCDVLAAAIRHGLTAYDLAELELCYAPPYSSAKDPVNLAGFAIENLLDGKVKQAHWQTSFPLPENAQLLDVRTQEEYEEGHIPGALHIPLDALRSRLDELDRTRPLYVHCQSGLRSYVACRILSQHRFHSLNLSGGYRLYALLNGEQADDAPIHACGVKIPS